MTAGALGGRLGALRAPKLAWIYGFSFEGHYYDLPKPTIFVVEDAGDRVQETLAATGLPGEPPEFYDDVRVWTVDRDDLGLRLDVESGSFEHILLDAEMRGDRLRRTGGINVRLQGGGINRPLSGTDIRRSD